MFTGQNIVLVRLAVRTLNNRYALRRGARGRAWDL